MLLRRLPTKVLSLCQPRNRLQTLFVITLSTSLVANFIYTSSSYSTSSITSIADNPNEDCGCSVNNTNTYTMSSSSSSGSNNAATAKDGKPSPVQFKNTEIINLHTGEKKLLGDVWKNQPTVLAFLRRLG